MELQSFIVGRISHYCGAVAPYNDAALPRQVDALGRACTQTHTQPDEALASMLLNKMLDTTEHIEPISLEGAKRLGLQNG